MKKSTRRLILLSMALACSSAAWADVAVKDQSVINELKEQLDTAPESVRKNQATQIGQFSDNRGMAELANGADGYGTKTNLNKRNYLNANTGIAAGVAGTVDVNKLPDDYLPDIESCMNNEMMEMLGLTMADCAGFSGTRNKSGNLRKSMKADFEALNLSGFTSSSDYKNMMDKIAEKNAQQIALHQVMAEEAYLQASQRFVTIQELLNKLNEDGATKDPKDVMDLQARIQAEQMMLQNEQIKLTALSQMQNLRRDIYEEKVRAANNYRRNPEAKYSKNPINHEVVMAKKKAIALAVGLANTALKGILKAE